MTSANVMEKGARKPFSLRGRGCFVFLLPAFFVTGFGALAL
jgi:hypothetical protein